MSATATHRGLDLNPELSLGTLVAEQPGRAQLFERLGLDYCCGGRQSLAEACAKSGLGVRVLAQHSHQRASLREVCAAPRDDAGPARSARPPGSLRSFVPKDPDEAGFVIEVTGLDG